MIRLVDFLVHVYLIISITLELPFLAILSEPATSFLNALFLNPVMDGQEAPIKSEANLREDFTSIQSDDDLYEEAGDLDFGGSTQALILARIPKFLWESWSRLGDEDEIQLGTIRFEGLGNDLKRVCYLSTVDFQLTIRLCGD